MTVKNDNILCDLCKTKYTGSNGKENVSEKKSKNYIEDDENEKENSYLGVGVVRKMLDRFLVEKKMAREEIVQILDITMKELEEILSNEKKAVKLTSKINLPLIKLYCGTFK